MLDKSLCVQLLQAGCFGSLAVALADRAAVRAAVLQFLQCSCSVLEVSVWRLNSCSRRQEPMPGRATLPCSCGMLVLIGKFATLQCWSFGRQSPKFVLKTGLWWNFCSFGNLAWEVSQCQARGCSLQPCSAVLQTGLKSLAVGAQRWNLAVVQASRPAVCKF